MVLNSSSAKTCKPRPLFTATPSIDLSRPKEGESLLVKACEEFGVFKVVNHGVPTEIIENLESEALKFFSLTRSEKEKDGPPDPFGYGSKTIGPNGDIGWLEYLLFSTNPQLISRKSRSLFQENADIFRRAVEDYIWAVRRMAGDVVEIMADGLRLEARNVFSKLLRDDKSDSIIRLNHYPPWAEGEVEAELCGSDGGGRKMVGFGEHTDPQILSVLRSNSTSGFQISLRDGTWLTVPPDPNSFFVLVGDALQVMTNGRFRSVKHRVLANARKPRVSIIYFGAPPPTQKIAPMASLMKAGEESLYREFTWEEYKKAAYKSRLGDYRLGPFEISPTPTPTPTPGAP